MSEEIKEKLDLFPDNMNDIAKEAYYQLENYITNLQQKAEQLENIRKEAIEYLDKHTIMNFKKVGLSKDIVARIIATDLLKILNKGE